jgi:hypothetical protein
VGGEAGAHHPPQHRKFLAVLPQRPAGGASDAKVCKAPSVRSFRFVELPK